MKKIFTLFAAMLLALTASATTPETNFEAPGYALTGTAATLDEGLLKETHFGEDRAYIRYDGGNHGYAAASWTINVTRGCYVTAKVFTADNSWQSSTSPWGNSGHSFGVELWNEDKTQRLDTIAEGPYALSGDGNRNYPAEGIDLNNKGILLIPTAGVYTFKLLNPRYWSRCGVDSVLITYYADAPTEIIPVSSVTLNKTEVTLDLQEVEQLTATVDPNNATDRTVNWTSDNTSVATVNANGLVTAGEAGTAIITCKAQADETKFATCTVTVAAAAVPDVKITSTYTLSAKNAHLEGAVWKKYEDGKYKIYGDGGHNIHYGNAFWTINVTNPCFLTASLLDVGGGSLYELDVFKGSDSITTVIQPVGTKWWSGIIDMTDTIVLAEAGEYTFRLRNTLEWSSGKTSGIYLTKDASKDVVFKGAWDEWALHPATTIAADGSSASVKVVLPAGDYDFGVTLGDDFRANGWWLKPEGPMTATGITGNTGTNMKVCPALNLEHTFTWTYATNAVTVTFPEVTVYFVNESDWAVVNAYAWREARTDNPEIKNADWPGIALEPTGEKSEGKDIYSYTFSAYKNIIFSNNGSSQTENLAVDPAKPYYYAGDWHETLPGAPTAIDNTVVGEKAVKLMENGQIVIIKSGVRYNVLGTVIK